MKITTSQTRNKYPLSSLKIIKKTVTGTISCFFLFIGLLFIFFRVGPGIVSIFNQDFTSYAKLISIISYVFTFFLVVIIFLLYLYQRWYFAVYFYDILDDYLVIRKGPITPKEITIPWEKIQDVYVDQDFFDRIFGLYDVHLSTATITSGMQAHIDGVEQKAANGLREELLRKIKSRISNK